MKMVDTMKIEVWEAAAILDFLNVPVKAINLTFECLDL